MFRESYNKAKMTYRGMRNTEKTNSKIEDLKPRKSVWI
jgi:hypothetical protein